MNKLRSQLNLNLFLTKLIAAVRRAFEQRSSCSVCLLSRHLCRGRLGSSLAGHSLRPQRSLTHSNLLNTDIYGIVRITAINGYRLNCGRLAGHGSANPIAALSKQPIVTKFSQKSLRQYISALRSAPLPLFQRPNRVFAFTYISSAQTQLVHSHVAYNSDIAIEIVQFDDFSFNFGHIFAIPAHGTPTVTLRSIQGICGASSHAPSSSWQSGQGHSKRVIVRSNSGLIFGRHATARVGRRKGI